MAGDAISQPGVAIMPDNHIRILQIHSDLQWGGVENWLLQATRHLDRSSFGLEFFAASVSPYWERSISEMQLEVIRSPRPRQFWQYLVALRRLLRERKYDAVHCHFADHSGVVLRLAAKAGVPMRIAHSHIDTGPILNGARPWHHAYRHIQNQLLQRYATAGISASREAAQSMFGPRWKEDSRWRVLHCGVDLAPLAAPVDDRQLRAEMGFCPEDVVFGHVGRFTIQKNHGFLVKVAARLCELVPRARFLWIGEGPLKSEIHDLLASTNLNGRVVFAGNRSNVTRLMRGAMDAFIFPSLYEGLGLALVEAQASGLRCFVSDAVPAEADVVRPLVTRLPLAAGPDLWAQRILKDMAGPPAVSPETALDMVKHSSFNIENSARALEALYRERL